MHWFEDRAACSWVVVCSQWSEVLLKAQLVVLHPAQGLSCALILRRLVPHADCGTGELGHVHVA